VVEQAISEHTIDHIAEGSSSASADSSASAEKTDKN
jgi:hypothetical protein